MVNIGEKIFIKPAISPTEHQYKHKIASSYSTLTIITSMVEDGYRFDDEDGPLILGRLKEAVQIYREFLIAKEILPPSS